MYGTTGGRCQGYYVTRGYHHKRTHCVWNNWRKMPGVLCDKRIPPQEDTLCMEQLEEDARGTM